MSHTQVDADDQVWPPREIRDLLEAWQAPEIEHGLSIALFNGRGVTTRGQFEGCQQERDLAGRYRQDAGKLNAWPRLHGMLIGLARQYESMGHFEDERVDKLRLRE